MGVFKALAASLPEGYVTRVPTLDDIDEVVALGRLCVTAGVSTGPSTAIDLRRHWEDPHRQEGDEDTLVLDDGGRIVGYLEYYQYEPYTLFEFEVYVHPEHAAISNVLVDMVDARARTGVRLAPEGERVALHGHTVSTALDLQQLLKDRGFEHIRNGLTMQIEMSERPPEAAWSPGMSVRRFIAGQDEHATWEAMEDSWQDVWGYSPMPFEEFVYYRITAQTDFDPSLWLLAMEGDTVAGVLLGLPDPTGKGEKGRVSVLGVRRAYRKRGIGLALLYEAFNEFWRRGYRIVNLGVDASSLTGADRLYERAGMREVGRTLTFEKVLRT